MKNRGKNSVAKNSFLANRLESVAETHTFLDVSKHNCLGTLSEKCNYNLWTRTKIFSVVDSRKRIMDLFVPWYFSFIIFCRKSLISVAWKMLLLIILTYVPPSQDNLQLVHKFVVKDSFPQNFLKFSINNSLNYQAAFSKIWWLCNLSSFFYLSIFSVSTLIFCIIFLLRSWWKTAYS